MIDLARARGIEVIERRVMPYELAHAKEVFPTGSAVEVTPVGEIDGATFSVGEVSKLMMADYDKAVGKPKRFRCRLKVFDQRLRPDE